MTNTAVELPNFSQDDFEICMQPSPWALVSLGHSLHSASAPYLEASSAIVVRRRQEREDRIECQHVCCCLHHSTPLTESEEQQGSSSEPNEGEYVLYLRPVKSSHI